MTAPPELPPTILESPRGRSRRGRLVAAAALLVLVAVVAAMLVVRGGAHPTADAADASETYGDPADDPWTGFSVVVDDTLVPEIAFVDGLEPGDAPRPVGRILDELGNTTDLVLDEISLAAYPDTDLDGFLARWNGTVVDEVAPEADGEPRELLVRVAPTGADIATIADDLLALEPHEGELRLGGARVAELMAVIADEATSFGLELTPNWIDESTAIEYGETREDPGLSALDEGIPDDDAFQFDFLRSGSAQDTGVTAAWQLLHAEGRLDERVEMMIVDGGFAPNQDFPADPKIRKGGWNEAAKLRCSSTPCWHGTQVALTALGQVDNQWGTAGVAGPVGDLIAVQHTGDRWGMYKTLFEVADEERPAVINMSYGGQVTTTRHAEENRADRFFEKVWKRGALPIASAGNEGINVDSETCLPTHCREGAINVPCESAWVLCVGGMQRFGTTIDSNSNFGTDDGRRSVEIFGPYHTYGVKNPRYADGVRWVTGTSFASPFVAGVAALVKAADPRLGPDEIRDILLASAHDGGVLADWVSGSEKRINALGAVSMALGVEPAAPEVRIDAPDEGDWFPANHWFELRATSEGFAGPLEVDWHSSLDGHLGNSGFDGDLDVPQLSIGDHVLTAKVTDTTGAVAEDWAVITVGNTPPTVLIGGGLDGKSFYEDTAIDLLGFTQDLEHYGQLPDDQVRWEVRRNGALVHKAGGHFAEIPSHEVQPGAYAVTFVGDDDGIVVEADASFTVKSVPVGEDPPSVDIIEPFNGAVFGVSGGYKAQVHLRGQAFDPQDGWLNGTRFRWTATSQAGTTIVLCEGSGWGEPGDGPQFVIEKDCNDITVELDIDPAVADFSDGLADPTLWTITLTAIDSAGLDNPDSVGITVQVMVG